MKRHNLYALLMLALCSLPVHAGLFDPLSWVKSQVEPSAGAKGAKGMYVTFGEDKQQHLARLKEEKAELEVKEKPADEAITQELERISMQIGLLKDKIKENRGSEFLQKKLSLLNEQHQTLIDRQLSHKQEIASLDQQIKMLEEYLRDPDYKGMTLDAKSFYSFENLQDIAQRIADQDNVISHQEEQKNSLGVDLENRKKQLEQAIRDLKNKEREQKEGTKPEGILDDHGFDIKQRAELLDLNIRLLNSKKLLFEQKIHEMKRKQSLLETKLFIERAKKKVLNDQRVNVKEGLRVEEADVQAGQAECERKRQIYLEKKDALYQRREQLAADRERRKKTFDDHARKLGITIGDLRELDDLPLDPADAEGFKELGLLLNFKEGLVVVDKKIELIDAQINLEDARFEREEIAVEFIESWRKLTMRKFRSEHEVETEINKYCEPGVHADQEVVAFTEKRNIATNFLTLQNKVFESLKQRNHKLEEYRYRFKDKPIAYLEVSERLQGSFNAVQGAIAAANLQIEINRQIIEAYSNIIQLRSSIKHQISGIIGELQSIGLRPPNAITWEGIKSIPTDFAMLCGEVVSLGHAYLKGFTVTTVGRHIKVLGITGIFRILMSLLVLLMLFMALRSALPALSAKLLTVSPEAGNLYFIGRFAAGIVGFVSLHFISLALWAVFYGALSLDLIADIFPRVIFYLLSIPFFIYLSNKLVHYFREFNESQDYLFLSKTAVERLYTMATVLLYATVSIFFFRQAFMLASYTKSELPTILLTIYSLTVRIMLISLISKEDLLEILPAQGEVWLWIRGQVERHFYPIFLFLVTLIVMSEPHVGYGKYVSYLLWGVIGTILLARAVMIIHQFVKRYSTILFFSSDADMQRERFLYAKSAYGLFVISSFVLFAFFAVIIGARMWGYTITFNNISDLLHTELFSLHEGTIDRKEVTIISLFQMIAFVLCSFVAASAANHFVIRRIFDLLLVDQGVQYTISTIMHYLIVAIVILIGLQRLGLGYAILVVLAPALFGIVWSLRDYGNDFVSYFIILVQRPFKIGDYVKLDGQVSGIVRKITPRSIVIREKNSVNILVPNSKVINGHIMNWNYTRSFTSFPDIHVAVPFSVDPAEVRTVMMRVLDANMNVLKNPKPVIRLDDFSEAGFIFLIRGFLSSDNVLNMYEIASDVRFALTKALRDNDIPMKGPMVMYKEMGQ